jgi:bla regulator protein BlaR1
MALMRKLQINLIVIALYLLVYSWMIASAATAQSSSEGSSAKSTHTQKQFEFEVFSIRPHMPGTKPLDVQFTPSGYIATTDLEYAIKLAYFPQDWRKWSSWKIADAPAWVNTDWYEVEARVAPEDEAAWQADVASWQKSGGLTDSKLLRSAWRAALTERCKLVVHMTPTEAPYLNLVLGKHGANLKETVPGAVQPVKLKTSKLGEGFYIEDNGERRFVGVSMEELANLLTRLAPDYPVQDKTGLTGRYDFTLPWYDRQHYPDSEFSNSLDRMPLTGAGLMLKPGKGPAFVINIDHIERPDAN